MKKVPAMRRGEDLKLQHGDVDKDRRTGNEYGPAWECRERSLRERTHTWIYEL